MTVVKQASVSPASGSRPTLLLVDDDAPLRRNLTLQLEREGYGVVQAASLREAYETTAETIPDAAVIDLNLEDGHGMELIDALLDMKQDMRIVVLTGYDSIASSILATKAGAVGYLAKPPRLEEMLAILRGDTPADQPPEELPMSADRIRWEYIQRVFEQCERNVSETARRLNMHRRTLQRILSKRAPR